MSAGRILVALERIASRGRDAAWRRSARASRELESAESAARLARARAAQLHDEATRSRNDRSTGSAGLEVATAAHKRYLMSLAAEARRDMTAFDAEAALRRLEIARCRVEVRAADVDLSKLGKRCREIAMRTRRRELLGRDARDLAEIQMQFNAREEHDGD